MCPVQKCCVFRHPHSMLPRTPHVCTTTGTSMITCTTHSQPTRSLWSNPRTANPQWDDPFGRFAIKTHHLQVASPTGPLTSLLPAITPRTRPSDDQVFAHKPQQTTLLRSPCPRVTAWEPHGECRASPMHRRSEESDACASALDLLRAKTRGQRVEKRQVQGKGNSKVKEGELRGKSRWNFCSIESNS